ncbi:CHAT domain-containing protein [Actinokineospora sp. 24-640]
MVAELKPLLYPRDFDELLDEDGDIVIPDTPKGVAMLRSILLLRKWVHVAPSTNLREVLTELLDLEKVADGEEPYASTISASVEAIRFKVAGFESDFPTARRVADSMEAKAECSVTRATALMGRTGQALQSGTLEDLRECQTGITDLVDSGELNDRMAQQLLVAWDHIENVAVWRFGVRRTAQKASAAPTDLPMFDQEIRLAGEALNLVTLHGLDRLDDAITLLRRATVLPGPPSTHRHAVLLSLGNMLLARFEDQGDRDDISAAIGHLEESRSLLDSVTHAAWSGVSQALSRAYTEAERRADGVAAGLDGLRGFAWATLLQPDPATAQLAVGDAVDSALEVADLALRAGMADEAVTALESGRGLLLYSALETQDLRTRLTNAGHRDLADEWARLAGIPVEELPADLRRRMIGALAGFTVGADGSILSAGNEGAGKRLSPPPLSKIRAALTRLDCDALVYLVPGDATRPGRAVVVPAADVTTWVDLPDLTAERARHLVAAGDGRFREVEPPRSAGDSVDVWAWQAAVEPLSRLLGHDGDARVVLVPFGELSLIAWHAAHSPDRRRYAVDRFRFSAIPSARLLCEVADRPGVPLGDGGLVLGDPDTGRTEDDLPAARAEALALSKVFYPDATYMGRLADGALANKAGTRADLLAWLDDPAGGPVMHLACHGATSPGAAFLVLADGTRLMADELLEALDGNLGRGVSLAVLAACRTGESVRGHDEAFSLGSAFLTAGFRSVVSTLWSVPDESTSVLMFMFHHFLRVEGLRPADALHAVRRWAVHDRHPPASMPEGLRKLASSKDIGETASWAPFTHFGW